MVREKEDLNSSIRGEKYESSYMGLPQKKIPNFVKNTEAC